MICMLLFNFVSYVILLLCICILLVMYVPSQKELAFTPAKNTKKPNPFKIIPLQPTRKENNWETKETMERAILTLETEPAKWPNPGCL
jgi:hypothetical protein